MGVSIACQYPAICFEDCALQHSFRYTLRSTLVDCYLNDSTKGQCTYCCVISVATNEVMKGPQVTVAAAYQFTGRVPISGFCQSGLTLSSNDDLSCCIPLAGSSGGVCLSKSASSSPSAYSSSSSSEVGISCVGFSTRGSWADNSHTEMMVLIGMSPAQKNSRLQPIQVAVA